jgi:hypothetical protein
MFAYWAVFFVFAAGALWYSSGAFSVPGHASTPVQGRQAPGTSNRLLLLAGLLTALMIGLRFEVGTDWPAYLEIFGYLSDDTLPRALRRIDPGYGLLNWLVARAGWQIWVVNLVCGFLFMFGLIRFARHQPNPWLAIAAAVPYLVIGVAMGFSRQSVAIGLSMAGLVAVSKGSFGRFVLWVLLGALFHRTAVILIPIVAIAYSRNRFQAFVIGLFGCLIGYYLLSSAQGLEHFQRTYVARTYEAQGAGIRLAMNLPPALLFLAMGRRFSTNDIELRIWRTFSIIAVLSLVGYLFISSTAALDRMALYILPLQIFVLSRVPTVFSRPGQPSTVLVAAVLAYSALIEFIWLNYSNNSQHWIPFQLYPVL